MSVAVPALGRGRRRAERGERSGSPLSRASGIGLGVATLWLSLVVLLPLATIVLRSTEGGLDGFVTTITGGAVAASLRLTIGIAVLATIVNVVMGTLIAWILVRDPFPGR